MEKVYCEECKWWQRWFQDEFHYSPDECYAPQNLKGEKSEIVGTYAQRAYSVSNSKPIKKPEEINKKNDCRYFKKRRGRRGVPC